jgi:hypothetical protein
MCRPCAGLWHGGSAQMEAGSGVRRGLALLCAVQVSGERAALVQYEGLDQGLWSLGNQLKWPLHCCVMERKRPVIKEALVLRVGVPKAC